LIDIKVLKQFSQSYNKKFQGSVVFETVYIEYHTEAQAACLDLINAALKLHGNALICGSSEPCMFFCIIKSICHLVCCCFAFHNGITISF